MTVPVPSTPGNDAGPPEAGLAARVAAGPGAWEDGEWLADLRRESLLESLMADGTVAAAASAEHAHKLERALNAEVTALCLACGALFPVLGYDAASRQSRTARMSLRHWMASLTRGTRSRMTAASHAGHAIRQRVAQADRPAGTYGFRSASLEDH